MAKLFYYVVIPDPDEHGYIIRCIGWNNVFTYARCYDEIIKYAVEVTELNLEVIFEFEHRERFELPIFHELPGKPFDENWLIQQVEFLLHQYCQDTLDNEFEPWCTPVTLEEARARAFIFPLIFSDTHLVQTHLQLEA